jgi:hypothetical protein
VPGQRQSDVATAQAGGRALQAKTRCVVQLAPSPHDAFSAA